jgi:Uncharacterized protein conserved in archaea
MRLRKMKEETKVTLIGSKLANVGTEFIFVGASDECENCKLRNSCINLEKGRRYRVVGKRGDVLHGCVLHDGGVKAVEVVEAPLVATIEPKKAFSGSKITYEPIDCDIRDCEFFDLCHPEGIWRRDTCTITKVLGGIDDCRKGYDLKLVELKI